VLRRLLIFAAILVAMLAGGGALIRFAGAGATEFRVTGPEMFIAGPISGAAADRIERLLDEHPELEAVVLGDIPGADDTGWLVQMGYLIRGRGLATRAIGDLNNDAILLFAAGVDREVQGGNLVITGADVARSRGWPYDDSSAARVERGAYARVMLGDAAFVEFAETLRETEDVHIITNHDQLRFGLVTPN